MGIIPIPVVPSNPSGDSIRSVPRNLYKYIPYSATKTVYIHGTKAIKQEKQNVDTNIIVLLGGSFEEIGERNEAVGGGNQKVGSTNKR